MDPTYDPSQYGSDTGSGSTGGWWDSNQPPPIAPTGAAAADPNATLAPGQIGGYGQAPAAYTPPSAALPTYTAPSLPTYTNFVAPTADQALAAPGTKFALDQARAGSEASAAAKGSVLSGGFQKSLGEYLENVAGGLYGNTFNQALTTNQNNNQLQTQGFNNAQQNAMNQYSSGFQNWQAQNAQAANTYQTNLGASHQAANDYYQALLDQQKLGQQAGTQSVTA